ncbi:ArgE/DapE family deacylase [Micromonospora sp. NPDC049679]|uniref:ArgE/DapE family deacylase n=1 Tax=Micromonospora sp. NPDC049679 TaxID=3155920 RepID=UPI0033FD8773
MTDIPPAGGAVSEQERAVTAALEASAEELARFVSDFVAIPSVSGSEGEAAAFVEDWLRRNGFDAERQYIDPSALERWPECAHERDLDQRPNIVGRLRTGDRRLPDLVLNGHLDVVPVGDESKWQRSPFSGARVGGRIFGRGATDMKGGLGAGLFAMRALRDAGVALPFDVQVQCVVAEETGGLGTLSLMDGAPLPSAVIVLEPTACRIVTAAGGAAPFTVGVAGRAAHVATPWTGVSAFDKLVKVHERLRRLEQERETTLDHPLFNQLPQKAPLSIGRVEAGDWRLTIPDEAWIYGRIGTLPSEDLDTVRAAVRRALDELGDQDDWFRTHPASLTWDGPGFAGWEVPRDGDLAASLLAAAAQLSGDTEPACITYGSDASAFARQSVPVALFGPGDIQEAHVKDESVAEADVSYASKVTALAISRFAATAYARGGVPALEAQA